MRFICLFTDGSTKRLTEEQANAMMKAKAAKQPILFKGAMFDPSYVKAIKPIDKHWFDRQTVEDHRDLEESAQKKLESRNDEFLKISETKMLHETNISPKQKLVSQLLPPPSDALAH